MFWEIKPPLKVETIFLQLGDNKICFRVATLAIVINNTMIDLEAQ